MSVNGEKIFDEDIKVEGGEIYFKWHLVARLTESNCPPSIMDEFKERIEQAKFDPNLHEVKAE